jgi:hypothetical protein
VRRGAHLAVCSAHGDRGTALVYAVSARRSRDRTIHVCAATSRDASASASTCPRLGHAVAAFARVRLVANGGHDRYRWVVPLFCSHHAARTLSVAVSALIPLTLLSSRSTLRFVYNWPSLSAHTITWVQCMGWLIDWACSRRSLSTFVADGLVDAPTCARHISPKNAARGHPTPFSWVLDVKDTTTTSFGARRHLSARSTFSAVGAELGYGHMGGRRRPRRNCARGAELAPRGVKDRVCVKNFTQI